MIVSDQNIALAVLHYTDWIVRDTWRSEQRGEFLLEKRLSYDSITFRTDGTQKLSIVREDLDAVRTIVGDEYFLFIVATNTVGKFQVFRAREFVQHISIDIEDEHAHHFAFHDNDMSHIIHTHS